MIDDSIFKSREFYKRKKERERDDITKKTDTIWVSKIYVAGKYRPIKYADNLLRITNIATTGFKSKMRSEKYATEHIESPTFRVTSFDVTPVGVTFYSQTSEQAKTDLLFRVTGFEKLSEIDIQEYYSSRDNAKTDKLFRVESFTHNRSDDMLTNIRVIKPDKAFPETMIRVTKLFTTGHNIE